MRSCCQSVWRSVNIALAVSECLHDAADELFVDVAREIDYHEDVGIGIGMQQDEFDGIAIACLPRVERAVAIAASVVLVVREALRVLFQEVFRSSEICFTACACGHDTGAAELLYGLCHVAVVVLSGLFRELFHHLRTHRHALYGCVYVTFLYKTGGKVLHALSADGRRHDGGYDEA